MFSEHNGIKLEMSKRKIIGKFSNTWKLTHLKIIRESKRMTQEKLKIF